MATGTLSSGRVWILEESRTSAVPIGRGKHYILHFEGNPPRDKIPFADQQEALGLATLMAEKLSEEFCPGRWRIEFNGPEAASQKHFHIHIIVVDQKFKIRRCVDPIRAS